MKKHILDNLSGLGYYQKCATKGLTLCGRYLKAHNLVPAYQSDCVSCQKRFEKLVDHYSQLDPENKPPDIEERIIANLEK